MSYRAGSNAKKLMVPIFIFAALFGLKWAFDNGKIPGLNQKAVITDGRTVTLPQAETLDHTSTARVADFNMPGTSPSRKVGGPALTFYQMAWQSQTGCNFANGGPVTTEGSLMEKYGVRLNIQRQDDVEQMKALLIEAAEGMASGREEKGAVLIAIMGDGGPAFLESVNEPLAKIGPNYIAQGFFSCGYSRGEDKLMGPPEWKDNPQAAIGATVASYVKDGDWNIMVEWANANRIPVNPDWTTYCPDALNNWNANDFLHAAQLYNTNAREERAVVDLDGRRTGQKVIVTVDGVATWTPGDVNIAESRGGLVSIVSTNEYYWQMPNLVIGIQAWLEGNRKTVNGFIEAVTDAGDILKSDDRALRYACGLNAQIWDEQTPEYWYKYFTIQRIRDNQGLIVECGGSAVNNLADNLQLFGLLEGQGDLYRQVYHEFGDILVEQYPEDVPQYPAYDTVVNKSFLRRVQSQRGSQQMTAPDAPTYASTGQVDEISRRSWNIEFQSGSADFTPQALRELEALYRQVSVGRLTVVVEGHTDSDGDAEFNMGLSERRAFAVKEWIQSQSPASFPNSRFRVRAFGETTPVAPNSTPDGKAQNRRVEIALGTTS